MFDRDSAPKILSEDNLDAIHEHAMQILEEIGMDVIHEPARDLLAKEGQKIDGERVRFDRGWIAERVAQAPSSFTLRARNPERSVVIGGGTPVLTNVGGPPFCSDLDNGRRSGTIEDHVRLVQLTQAAGALTCVQSGAVEPVELPVETRSLDMDYSVLRWTDKPFTGYGTSGAKSVDAIEMARIACGGTDVVGDDPVTMIIINPNSPLIWDTRMADALMRTAAQNQPTVITPFLLAGATSPVSVAGALAIQVAEALSGVAIAQSVRPGAPCLYGSFFTATDMRTGSPAFGTPESVIGILAGAQVARRYGLPFRGGGGLASANSVDGQAAAETQNMLWATMLAGTDFVLHAAGWLEGGLCASYEKLALDLELLSIFAKLREGIGFSEEEFGFDALAEVGPGGLFLGSPHTMKHFKEWLYMSPLFQTPDFATWESMESLTVADRANVAWKQLLEGYEDPGLDPAIDEELREYMDKRKADPPEPED
ncbi:MAG: trimethylamine methyltransferase family protein [Actinomycetota bacterium]